MNELVRRPGGPPRPPFTEESAALRVRMAEDSWNTRDPERVAPAYAEDCRWRNRDVFLQGRAQVVAFLRSKWERELDYRLVKEPWASAGNRIAVRFVYEWHDAQGQWFRSHGNENWQFGEDGLMQLRLASINDQAIRERDRVLHWEAGARPVGHPGLADLGL